MKIQVEQLKKATHIVGVKLKVQLPEQEVEVLRQFDAKSTEQSLQVNAQDFVTYVPAVVTYRAISSRVNRGLLESRTSAESLTVDMAYYCAVIVQRLAQVVAGQPQFETIAEFDLLADGKPTDEALDFFQSIDLDNLTAIFEAVQNDLTPNPTQPEALPAG